MVPRSWHKRLKIFAVVLLVVTATLMVVALSWDMTASDSKIKEDFQQAGLHVSIGFYIWQEIPRRYIELPASDSASALLVFVHGAPGGCNAFSGMMKDDRLNRRFDMLSYDRPGYGPNDREAFADIQQQSEYLTELVRDRVKSNQKVILVSHSFGGPIAALSGMSLGGFDVRHVMLSPVISHLDEKLFWYSGMPLWPPFSWFSSAPWKAAAVEKLSHKDEIEKLASLWSQVETQTLHIHGSRDWLAPVANVEFCQSRFDARYYRSEIWPDASHFIPWTRIDDIVQRILSLI